ncbi:MAG: M6 family metalloprotease domain-containing protein [Planctomycetota bacterium]
MLNERSFWVTGGVVVALLALAVPLTRADYVDGEVLPMTQPDGTLLQVRIWGDEFYTVVETLDGYTLIRDPLTGYICYAGLSEDGNALYSTGVAVGTGDPAGLGLARHVRINPEAAAAQARVVREHFRRYGGPGPWSGETDGLDGPTVGDVKGICLIVDFVDDVGTIPPAEVTAYCNQPGYTGFGNNGSIYDYFHDVSDELLRYTNYVPAAYYRALHPKTYYNDPNISYGLRARELIIEALTHLDGQGFNFAEYDADHDGYVDALNCLYAGNSNSAWAQGLWPHAWTVDFCADGVCTRRYQITDMRAALRISTFCHENGHMLMGWPDLYDYDGDSRGVGRFCIMCSSTSATNPQHPCAYNKATAQWSTVHALTVPQIGLEAPVDVNVAYKFPHPTRPNEYYLIENRQRIGRDVGLPDAGLAIWQIDTQGSNNYQERLPNRHYKVTLVQADGRWDLENNRNSGDTTDLWKAPTYTQCTPFTNPNTNWWAGNSSDLYVLEIGEPGPVMTFTFRTPTPPRPGDLNCDGAVDFNDINPFVLILQDPGAWQTAYPACPPANGDVNGDGHVDLGDINPFVALLAGP